MTIHRSTGYLTITALRALHFTVCLTVVTLLLLQSTPGFGQDTELPPNMLGPSNISADSNSPPVTQHTVQVPVGNKNETRVRHIPRRDTSLPNAENLPLGEFEQPSDSDNGSDPLDQSLASSNKPSNTIDSDLMSFLKSGNSKSILKVVGGLCVVAAIFFAFTIVARKGGARVNAKIPTEIVQPIAQMPLDSKRHLQLIRFGGKILLLSVSDKHMETLSELDDPIEVEHVLSMIQSGRGVDAFSQFRRITWQKKQQRRAQRMYPSPLTAESEDQDPRLRVESHNVFEA